MAEKWWDGDKTGRDPGEELNELRRAVAETLGADPDTWPDHGNAPLAISAFVASERAKREELADALVRHLPAAQMLAELVRRGHVHKSRLLDDHIVNVDEEGWTMSHPLSCDLGDCRFHRAAVTWDGPPAEPGTYRYVVAGGANPATGYEAFRLVPAQETP